MAGPLAVPTFRSKPDDKYAAVDVYTKRDSAVVNNIEDVITRSAGSVRTMDLLNSMRGGKAAGGLLSVKNSIKGNLLSGITKGALTEGKEMLDRLGSAGLSKVVGGLSPALQGLVSAKLSGNSYSMKSALVGAAGTLTKVGISALPSLGDVSATLTKWTGAAGLKIDDPNALGAFGSALVTQGLRGGSAGVLTAMAGQLNAGGVLTQVVKDTLPDVKKYANLGALKEMVGLSPEPLAGMDKNLLADISANLPVPEFPLTGIEYQEKFGTIKETFAAIEPKWNVHTHYIEVVIDNGEYMTKEQSLFDASKIVVASEEFKKTVEIGALVSNDPKDKLMLVAAKLGSDKTAEQKIAQQYPAAVNNSKGTLFASNSADSRNVAVNQQLTKDETKTDAPYPRPLKVVYKEREAYFIMKADERERDVVPLEREALDLHIKYGPDDDRYRAVNLKAIQLQQKLDNKYRATIDKLDAEYRAASGGKESFF